MNNTLFITLALCTYLQLQPTPLYTHAFTYMLQKGAAITALSMVDLYYLFFLYR